MNYVFITDSDSDLPLALKNEWQIPVVYMPFTVDGREYFDDLGATLDSKAFFEKMRAGAVVKTSAQNTEFYLELFEPYLKEGTDILFVSFSSRMSSTFKAIETARDELLPAYPGRAIRLVDTLSISCAMSVLLYKAHELYAAGADMETVAGWIEANRLRARALFTVDDLEYLKRGGRITGTVATLGKLLDLKPILEINREGLIVSTDKVRGRRHALNHIVNLMAETMPDETEAPAFVIHADAPEDAALLEGMIRERFPKLRLITSNVGPVIGAHAGPGTAAVCYLGTERTV